MTEGTRHHSAKLTKAKVRAIRRLYWCKHIGGTCLSRMYGFSTSTIYDCVNYVTWRHVEDTFKPEQVVRDVK